jgi:hypothetical protein
MATSGLTTASLKSEQSASANKSNDIQINRVPPTKEDGPKVTSELPKPKRASFSARKEDPALIGKMDSDEDGTAGTFNGVGSFIDGYLRINKRKYGRRK